MNSRRPMQLIRPRHLALSMLLGLGCLQPASAASATQAPVHGMWIWKSAAVLQVPQAGAAIRSFCESGGINEVYVSVGAHYGALEGLQLVQLIALLHEARVRVEALISSTDADEPGSGRTRLLDHVQAIVQFNRAHGAQRFDGIHLDIEPQQRPENKGPGNLQFLPGLIQTYRAVRLLTDRNGLTLDADIQSKLLKADLEQRRALLSSLPRLTLMMYELQGSEQQVRDSSQRFLSMAYQGLDQPGLARLSVALRTADYGARLPQMLAALDEANRDNPHYLGWARHSYNDTLSGARADGQP
jgi:hypothetical protein